MPEEITGNSLSTGNVRDEDMPEAYERARTLMDLDVLDVDGRRVGRVTRCFADDGKLTECEVTLDKDVRRNFSAPGDTVRVKNDWFGDVGADGARLTHPAAEVVRGESAAREGGTGGQEFPRKTR